MTVTVRVLSGAALAAALDDLARLRIAVFADWPYLYAGSLAYEQDYLAEFTAAQGAVLVAAFAGDAIVGVATASPLDAQDEYIRRPFLDAGLGTDRVFYFGESVLLPAWRGQGIGHVFFDAREAAARDWGAAQAAFCAVVRAHDHPRRPADYTPLDPFWRRRGYAPAGGMIGQFAWQDHGEPAETLHPMQYWMRDL